MLVIDEAFGKDFGTDRAARVALVFDRSKSRAASRVGRLRGAVDAYGQQIGMLRLVANGVDPSLLRPLVVDELDVSTPASRSALMLGVLTYFLLFATLTGGLHLAIDTTAGERERKSLEPLLTLPVARASLLVGKMTATVCYMLASLALTLVAFTIALRQMPLEQIGMSSNFGVRDGGARVRAALPVRAARRRADDDRRLVHQDLSRGSDVPHLRAARADAAAGVRDDAEHRARGRSSCGSRA